jgi:hydrogenase maturation protease
MTSDSSRLVTVIGVGNPYRCDDAVGLVVSYRVGEHFDRDPRVRAYELDGEPVRMVQSWEGSEHVIVVDAVRTGAAPGTRHRFTVDHLGERTAMPTADGLVGGGHALGVGDAVDLAVTLGTLPPSFEIWAIEGETFDQGAGLTPAVADACDLLIAELIDHVHRILDDAT